MVKYSTESPSSTPGCSLSSQKDEQLKEKDKSSEMMLSSHDEKINDQLGQTGQLKKKQPNEQISPQVHPYLYPIQLLNKIKNNIEQLIKPEKSDSEQQIIQNNIVNDFTEVNTILMDCQSAQSQQACQKVQKMIDILQNLKIKQQDLNEQVNQLLDEIYQVISSINQQDKAPADNDQDAGEGNTFKKDVQVSAEQEAEINNDKNGDKNILIAYILINFKSQKFRKLKHRVGRRNTTKKYIIVYTYKNGQVRKYMIRRQALGRITALKILPLMGTE